MHASRKFGFFSAFRLKQDSLFRRASENCPSHFGYFRTKLGFRESRREAVALEYHISKHLLTNIIGDAVIKTYVGLKTKKQGVSTRMFIVVVF